MSDASNLNDFFAQNKKVKKGKKGAGPKKTAAAPVGDQDVVAGVPDQVEPVADAAPAQQDYADSSDEENNLVVASQEIIERKDLEASKNKKTEDNDLAAGWGLGSKLGQAAETNDNASAPSFSSAKGPQMGMGGSISFGKKPPMFTRKQKGIMDNDFPDLDVTAQQSKGDSGASKASGPMMFTNSGMAARGPREPLAVSEESKGPAKMPVFTGKAKLKQANPVATEEETGSRMNYDFSRMGMSAATTGKKPDGEQRGEGEFGRRAADYSDDDDFAVVQEKKKAVPRPPREGEHGEPAFGGGKPMFTRGGGNRDQ